MSIPKAVFAGDSITDCSRRSDPSGHLGAGYVRRLSEMVNRDRRQLLLINRGVSGDRASDLEARWDRDVLSERPDIVTILVGINDTWRRYDAGEATSASAYSASLQNLIDTSKEGGIATIVLMEPFLVPRDAAQRRWRAEDLDEKIAAVHAVGHRNGVEVISLDKPFALLAERSGAAQAVEDGVHPAAAGHQLIADRWLRWFRGTGCTE